MLGGMNHWENGRKLNDVGYKKTDRGGQVPYSPVTSSWHEKVRLLSLGLVFGTQTSKTQIRSLD